MYFMLNDYCMVKPPAPPPPPPSPHLLTKKNKNHTTLRHKNSVVIESMCSHFFFLNMPSVYVYWTHVVVNELFVLIELRKKEVDG